MELVAVFERPEQPARFGIRVLQSPAAHVEVAVEFATAAAQSFRVFLNGTALGAPEVFVSDPVRMLDGEAEVSLDIFVDRSLVEVFAQGGRAAVTVAPQVGHLGRPPRSAAGVELFSAEQSTGLSLRSITAYAMGCMWAAA